MNVMNVPDRAVTFTADDRAFVYSVARRIVGNEDDAADVAQEALLLAFRHREDFRGTSRYRTWLYRIAAFAALSHLRRGRRRRVADSVSLNESPGVERELVSPDPDPESQVGAAQVVARVRGELAQLPPRYREILQLRFEDGRSEEEVAGALGLSRSNVKVRTHRARHALRAALALAA